MVEFLTGGPPDRRRKMSPAVLVLAVAIALAALVTVPMVLARRADVDPGAKRPATASTPTAPPESPAVPAFRCPDRSEVTATPPATSASSVAALILPGTSSRQTVDRWDRAAESGPWSVLVRRRDGTLGWHGAIVTYPVSGSGAGRQVPVGAVTGRLAAGELSWPVGKAWARVRGDLGATELHQIALATRVRSGRPTVVAPAGYTVVRAGPYRSPHDHEIRYETDQPDWDLGGLVYTVVTSGFGLEEQLLTAGGESCGQLHGRPAVVSSVGGGNGTIAWEVAPGLVGYVGFSGSVTNGSTQSALVQLAQRSQTIDTHRWRATSPQVVEQRNDAS